jgi:Protein of unknown function (DUF4232)
VQKSLLIAALAATGLVTAACSGGSGTPKPASTVTVTASPTATQSSQTAATTAPTAAAAGCLSRYLNGSVGLSQGTAGSVDVAIVFKNLDNVPCTLYGYPGVALAAGTPVTDTGQPSTENPATARELVTLQPGGYANATLQITDAANYSPSTCDPVAADWLAVIPPNQTIPLYIHYSSTACKSMSVKLLTVSTVQPGNGG